MHVYVRTNNIARIMILMCLRRTRSCCTHLVLVFSSVAHSLTLSVSLQCSSLVYFRFISVVRMDWTPILRPHSRRNITLWACAHMLIFDLYHSFGQIPRQPSHTLSLSLLCVNVNALIYFIGLVIPYANS